MPQYPSDYNKKAAMPAGFPEVPVPGVSMTVDAFLLMRSDREKKGMIYTEIGIIFSDLK